jgi:5-methylcytosine-specific restriction enzyme subunit McrC
MKQYFTTKEYGEWQSLNNVEERQQLQKFLDNVWEKRAFPFAQDWITDDETQREKNGQAFLQFDGKDFRAKNFVGFIQTGDIRIDIFPKVFGQEPKDKKLMLRHLFYWLSYCSKIRFPFLQSNLDIDHIDSLPELLIFLISHEIRAQVSDNPISMYEQKEEIMTTPRGRIDFSNYVKNGLSTGNWQNVDCIHEPFVYDNRVNQIIKYTCRLLQNTTKISENRQILDDIIFVLDEVEDCFCTVQDIDKVKLSPLFVAYSDILQWCRMILEQQIHSSEHDDSTQWCFLMPMEYVFEDFIAGFTKRHFSDNWKVKPQSSEKYLCEGPSVFLMKHDILLTSKESKESKDSKKRTIILDTKYKLRSEQDFEDKKKGVSQSDMYQMVSYGLRRGCENLYLIYPNLYDGEIRDSATFTVESNFMDNAPIKINIHAIELPFWSLMDFEHISEKLKKELSKILGCKSSGEIAD